MDAPPKLEPMSMNVGRDPVVKPLIRCRVVVGGSANESNRNECDGRRAVNSCGRRRTLW